MCIRDRARIAEKIRKKIGIDIDVKPETVTQENLAAVNNDTETESKKEAVTTDVSKKEENSYTEVKKDPSVAETKTEKKLENLKEKK